MLVFSIAKISINKLFNVGWSALCSGGRPQAEHCQDGMQNQGVLYCATGGSPKKQLLKVCSRLMYLCLCTPLTPCEMLRSCCPACK